MCDVRIAICMHALYVCMMHALYVCMRRVLSAQSVHWHVYVCSLCMCSCLLCVYNRLHCVCIFVCIYIYIYIYIYMRKKNLSVHTYLLWCTSLKIFQPAHVCVCVCIHAYVTETASAWLRMTRIHIYISAHAFTGSESVLMRASERMYLCTHMLRYARKLGNTRINTNIDAWQA